MTQQGEEAAELIATMRGDHVAMKQWYNSNHPTSHNVRAKYGNEYPAFWRDVINWAGWKDTRKAYLTYLEKNDGSQATAEPTSTVQEEPKRKRRSRWSTAEEAPSPRKSRWSQEQAPDNNAAPNQQGLNIKSALSAAMTVHHSATQEHVNPEAVAAKGVLDLLPGLPASLTPEQQQRLARLQARLRHANERLANLEQEAARIDALPRGHRERSPSPPPVYGPDGKRKNTRAVRWRERYTNERLEALEQIMELNSAFKVAGFQKRKRTRKIYIPVEQHPTYNFIGLIIGPRGKTQKEMENKTNCKIAIRGKGSIKEGARGRKDGKMMEGDDEPLHVVITGDEQPNVDAAAKLVEEMLVVIDDDKNLHKQNQLRELALLNGTLKEDDYCTICAERGHRPFECPKRFTQKKTTIDLKCAICGDTSHPTRDCTQRQAGSEAVFQPSQLDSDYQAFMAELDGGKRNASDSTSAVGVPPTATPASTDPVADPSTVTLANPPLSGHLPPVALPPPVNHPSSSLPTMLSPDGLPPPIHSLPPPPSHGLPPPPPTQGLPPPPPPPPGLQPFEYSAPQPALPPAAPLMYPGIPPPAHEYPPHDAISTQMHAQSAWAQQQQVYSNGPHDPYNQNNQQIQNPARRKKRRGQDDSYEEETLQGWNPNQYYQHDSVGGFNWWEQGK